MIYLDNSATTAPTKEVIKAVADTMEGCFGNPSSRHFLGTEAEKLLTDCRKRTAKALGVLPE